MRIFLVLALLVALASCASISKEECIAGNWEEIGFRDGVNGQYQSYIQSHAKACERVDVRPDPVAWERGRLRGLPAYCVPQKAYDVGRQGRSVNNVCPAAKMPALQSANAKGRRYYDISQDINEADRRIGENERRLVSEKNAAVRNVLVRENRSLRREIRLLELQRARYDTL